MERALTDSPAAYRHYVAGEVALHQRRWRDSVQHLDQAIHEDPTFALAYYRKAMRTCRARPGSAGGSPRSDGAVC